MTTIGQCEPRCSAPFAPAIASRDPGRVRHSSLAGLCAPAAVARGHASAGVMKRRPSATRSCSSRPTARPAKATITQLRRRSSRSAGAKLAGASLHLGEAGRARTTDRSSSRSRATRAYAFVKGTGEPEAALRRPSRTGYALARVTRPLGRYQTLATIHRREPSAASPTGAGKLGRVGTAKPMGLKGPGADLDLDGVVSAFDIDDNGNLVLDNVDRTGRGAAAARAASGSGRPRLRARRPAQEPHRARRRSTRRGSSTCSPTSGRRPSAPGRRCRPRRSTRTSPRSPTSTPSSTGTCRRR